nr:hypothetical protein [Escherichia coli]
MGSRSPRLAAAFDYAAYSVASAEEAHAHYGDPEPTPTERWTYWWRGFFAGLASGSHGSDHFFYFAGSSRKQKMSDEKIPDRIKAKLTIELDFAKEDQPLIGEVLQGILDNLGLSSEGSGSRTAQSHYSYKLESNLPKVPMTMERLFDLMDQAREPGEPTAAEQIADSMHPNYDEAVDWWESLAEGQKQWFIKKHPDVKLVTKAWEVHKEMDFADRVFFQTLK